VVTAALAFVSAAAGVAGLAALLAPRRAPINGAPAETSHYGTQLQDARRSPAARLLSVLALAGRLMRPPGAPPDLRARIEAAGRPAGLGVREVMAAKIAAAVLAGVAALPLAALAPGRLGLVLGPLGPVAGFLAPDLWLARLAAERARRVRRDLPSMLDMLRVTVEAGGSLAWALRSVGERADGPLAREWQTVAREVALGVPLGDALQALTRRLPQPEVRALVAALERSRRHGAPLAETLAAQARAARFSLARRIRDDAARASPKIQLVVALLLVPSVLLLVAAALASALLDGGADAVPL
jgi:tight adherence protein C